jgi:Mce-associated membrane protein
MSVQSPPRSNAAWVVAGVLGVVTAVLVVLLVHVASVRASASKASGSSELSPTPDQLKAVQSGAIEAANLTTLSRANYDADFNRALAGATGTLRQDLLNKKASYLSAMQAGKFDLKSSVIESAYESESNGKVLILVTINGSHVVDKVVSPITTPQRLELTMVRSGGKWLAADLLAVGVQ